MRNARLDLGISICLRRRDEVGDIEVDAGKWGIDSADDFQNCLRLLGDATVVFDPKGDTALAGASPNSKMRKSCAVSPGSTI